MMEEMINKNLAKKKTNLFLCKNIYSFNDNTVSKYWLELLISSAIYTNMFSQTNMYSLKQIVVILKL